MKILTEEQLKKLSTARLLGIRKVLTPALAFHRFHALGETGSSAADKWCMAQVEILEPYDALLRQIMDKREHVVRKVRRAQKR